jgi:hypothetical protein
MYDNITFARRMDSPIGFVVVVGLINQIQSDALTITIHTWTIIQYSQVESSSSSKGNGSYDRGYKSRVVLS